MAQTDTNGIFNIYDDNKNIDTLSLEDQVVYFKNRYEQIQSDFEEFQHSSSELENELETQLSILEKKVRVLENQNSILSSENGTLKSKFDKMSIENRNQIGDLQMKLNECSELNERLTTHIRELEQSNDDLERAKRHLDATLSDFDTKLNQQIERNELLESEIGEKEELQFVIQRLKDEAKDLRLELMIQQNFKSKKILGSQEDSSPSSPCSNKIKLPTTKVNSDNSVNLTNGVDDKTPYGNLASINHNTPNKQAPNQIPLLSASSRISALNIVSDLLRKVGALESKLASCRNIMPVASTTRSNSITKSTINTNTNNNTSPDNSSSINSTLKNIDTNV